MCSFGFDFSNIDFSSVSFTDTPIASYAGAGAIFRNCTFSGGAIFDCYMHTFDFAGSTFADFNLGSSSLNGASSMFFCNFKECNFSGDFYTINLDDNSGNDFSNSNFNCYFPGSQLYGIFDNCNFGYSWGDITATDVSFKGSDFSNSSLSNSLFDRCDFQGAKFNGFGDNRFTYCNFRNAEFTNSTLVGALLNDSDFRGAIGLNSDINIALVNPSYLYGWNFDVWWTDELKYHYDYGNTNTWILTV
jgi:hypothetical protein